MSRRFVQFLAAYACGAWGVLQFIDWLVTRYLFSRSIVDFYICFALLMLPTALLVGWYLGRNPENEPRGRRRLVAFGVPLNVVVALVVLFVVFHGKRLGATTTIVTVHDDNGGTVDRRVPKVEFRKAAALFTFDNAVNDPGAAWLRHGIPMLLSDDLDQDQFLSTYGPFDFRTAFQRAQQNIDGLVPLGFARQLCESHHIDFIVFGHIGKDAGVYRIGVTIYSQSGHVVETHEVSGGDLFALVDQLTPMMRRDFGVPEAQLRSAVDLPVAEITTHSLPALAQYVQASHRLYEENLSGAVPYFDKAVANDPTFALAHLQLFYLYFRTDPPKAQQSMNAVLANVYKLPERTRFQFKSIQYLLHRNTEKQKAVLINWVTLYPQSVQAHTMLGEYYLRRGDMDRALASFREAHALDPTAADPVVNLASIYEQRDEIDQSIALQREFLQHFPNDTRVLLQLAHSCEQAGRFDEAKRAYEQALSADPDTINAVVGAARADFALGQYDAARAQLEKLLAQTSLAHDQVDIYEELIRQAQQRGQMKVALATFEREQAVSARFQTAVDQLLGRLGYAETFVRAGRLDDLRANMRRATADKAAMDGNPNLLIYAQQAQLVIDDLADDADAMTAHLPSVETSLRDFGIQAAGAQLVLPYQARIAELRHDDRTALKRWQEAARLDLTSARAATAVARCQRKLGDVAGARAQLKRTLTRFPSEAEAHSELALTEQSTNAAVARAALAKALAIWAPADADYAPAKAARGLSTKLETSSR